MAYEVTQPSNIGFQKSFNILFSRYLRKSGYTLGALPNEQVIHNRFWEWYLNADTYGIVDITIADGTRYEPTPYLIINEILNRLELKPDDVFADLGCGKGRSLLMAARRNIKKVIGVEFDSQLLQVAERNIANLKNIRPEIELSNCLAQKYDFSNVTIIYMYNPFGPDTIDEVLDEVHKTLITNPRDFRIAYVNPQHDEVLEQRDWLEQYDLWYEVDFPDFYIYPHQPRGVSYWRFKAP